MFQKTRKTDAPARKKETTPSIITHEVNLLGNIVSDGVVDIDGSIDGNVRCDVLTVRSRGVINGEAVANSVFVYGKIKGLIKAKTVYLYGSSHIEGIVMHESLTIEDGAFIDGKCKRTDKVERDEGEMPPPFDRFLAENKDDSGTPDLKILENIRLIR